MLKFQGLEDRAELDRVGDDERWVKREMRDMAKRKKESNEWGRGK